MNRIERWTVATHDDDGRRHGDEREHDIQRSDIDRSRRNGRHGRDDWSRRQLR